MSIFLLGAVGLAIDGSQLYAQRQMAQAAADAAATAGIVSVFNASSTVSTATCTTTSTMSPCVYGRTNGFGTTTGATADTVSVNTNPGVTVCSGSSTCSLDSGTPNEVQVTITRPVSMSLMKLMGFTSLNITARATAAVLDILSPIPILVLNPGMKGAFSINGSGNGQTPNCSGTLEAAAIVICGGPVRSIQVNSGVTCSVSGNPNNCSNSTGTVDLSQAGPNGTGAAFGDIGGPSSYPGTLLVGSSGSYQQPVGIFNDPLAGLSPPPQPTNVGSSVVPPATVALTAGTGDCPSAMTAGCTLYSPGYYDSGISPSGYAIFRPGIYYINHNGFQLASGTIGRMAVTAPYNTDNTVIGNPDHTNWTSGMLVYNNPGVDGTNVKANKDIISIDANSGKINNNTFVDATNCPSGGNCLIGASGGVLSAAVCSSPASLAASYYGVLFFQAHATPAALTHTISGGAGMTLVGTIYLHDPTSSYADFQTLNLQGNSGSTTTLQGEIIVDALGIGGTAGVTMNLSAIPCYKIRQIALIQ
jgi:hypothetical protein